ncbi:MAG: 5-amino-6-(D-ribitylamino)uracil--L-tyrosine 4-hydroxyphenyl transferase CofH [Methanolinea sp.]|nr:5-amino-6-(D-ribitylamino)uracil--L-tyrosine 4-hydroxyphenyl transferase CofH [Methanolinea sp.]
MDLRTLLSDVAGGHRLTEEEAVALLSVRDMRSLFRIFSVADRLREERAGDIVTYVRNQNLHITNICKNLCGFCAFGRRETDPGAFCDDREIILKKAALAAEREVSEICLLSGVHPRFDAGRYIQFLSWVREAAPGVHLHAYSPDEVNHAAHLSGITTREVLEQMKSAGLGSLQGTAAEILVDRVRGVICPNKVDTATWVRVIREAHSMGIPSTATIMYGSCESAADRIRHLAILREIQDQTRGFSELVPLSYLHRNTALYRDGLAPAGATGREDLLMFSLARLFLDNFRNIQVSWGKIGEKLGQAGIMCGANDLAGTMFSDDVSGDAGAVDADYLDPSGMERMAEDAGRVLRRRLTDYTLAPL